MSTLDVVLDDVLATASSTGPVLGLVVIKPFYQNPTEQRLVVNGARVIVTVHRSTSSVLLEWRLYVIRYLHTVLLSRREDPHRYRWGSIARRLTARGR